VKKEKEKEKEKERKKKKKKKKNSFPSFSASIYLLHPQKVEKERNRDLMRSKKKVSPLTSVLTIFLFFLFHFFFFDFLNVCPTSHDSALSLSSDTKGRYPPYAGACVQYPFLPGVDSAGCAMYVLCSM